LYESFKYVFSIILISIDKKYLYINKVKMYLFGRGPIFRFAPGLWNLRADPDDDRGMSRRLDTEDRG
jgi:hypothetical protein